LAAAGIHFPQFCCCRRSHGQYIDFEHRKKWSAAVDHIADHIGGCFGARNSGTMKKRMVPTMKSGNQREFVAAITIINKKMNKKCLIITMGCTEL
jgi:hypothetical protein